MTPTFCLFALKNRGAASAVIRRCCQPGQRRPLVLPRNRNRRPAAANIVEGDVEESGHAAGLPLGRSVVLVVADDECLDLGVMLIEPFLEQVFEPVTQDDRQGRDSKYSA